MTPPPFGSFPKKHPIWRIQTPLRYKIRGNFGCQICFLGFARDSHPCLCIPLWPLNTRVSHFPQSGGDHGDDHVGDLMSTFTRYFTRSFCSILIVSIIQWLEYSIFRVYFIYSDLIFSSRYLTKINWTRWPVTARLRQNREGRR